MVQECEASGAVSIGATTGTDSRAAANDGPTSGRGKGDASASAHFTSDSGSRKTAFAMARRSGVNSTPESRDTCTGGGKLADVALASNMASSICQKVLPPMPVPPMVAAELPPAGPPPAGPMAVAARTAVPAAPPAAAATVPPKE